MRAINPVLNVILSHKVLLINNNKVKLSTTDYGRGLNLYGSAKGRVYNGENFNLGSLK